MKMTLTISLKLTLLILIGGLFMFAVAAMGYWAILDLEQANAAQLQRIEMLRVHLEADMAHDAVRADVLDAILLGLDKKEIDGIAGDVTGIREKSIKAGFQQHAKAIQAGLAQLDKPSSGLSTFASGTQADLDHYITYAATMIDDAVGDPNYARTRLSGFLDLFAALEKSMAVVSGEIERLATDAKHKAEAEAQRDKEALAGIALAAAIIGFLIAYGLARSITRPLAQAVRVAKAVADGDLTQRIEVKGNDEIANLMQCFADMNRSLNGRIAHLAGEIQQSSQTIFDASGKLVLCSASLSERTEAQASTMEETAASIEQIASAVKQNADNAAEANRLADVASQVAGKGGAATANMVNTMRQIHSKSLKISDIISVMDGIAFQTNILALNAAVEAARAGEQGRGFAVVAAEVRNLALRSAGSAKEVKSLIEGTVREIETASKVADDAGETVDVTVKNTHAVTLLMSQIAAASREQSDSIEQMALAIAQVERASEKNGDLVQDAGMMAEQLAGQASHLMGLLAAFKIDAAETRTIGGKTRSAAMAERAVARVSTQASSLETKPRVLESFKKALRQN